MSWRVPVSTQDVVHVTSDVPTASFEFKRYSTPLLYGSITWLAVPNGHYWIVDSVQINLNCDANVGNRQVRVYTMMQDGNMLEFQSFTSAAAFVNRAIHQPGLCCTDYSGLERTFTGPLHASVLPFPARIGALWDTFQGAGDIGSLNVVVRDYKVA